MENGRDTPFYINRTCEVKSEVHGVRMTPLKRMPCMRACVRAKVRAHARAYVRVCVCMRFRVYLCEKEIRDCPS